MSRYTIFAVIAALCLTIASADLSSASYSAPPGKVFDGSTGAADVLTWGTYTEAHFGPGTENTTLYAYGLLVTSGTTLTTLTSRKLNATILSNGTAATAVTDAKIGDDAVASPGTAITSYKVAVGNGSIGIAYATGSATVCPQITVVIYNGGSSSAAATKAVTTNTCSKCTDATAASTGVGYGVVVTGLFYENSTYYVSWTSTKYTETSAGSGTDCSANFPTATGTIVKAQVFSYLQGVTTAGDLKWTTAAVTIFTGTESAANVAPSPLATTIAPTCGPQNYTASTNFYCVYSDGSNNIKAVKVTVADGTADSGTTIATSVPYPGTAPTAETTYNTYTFAGFVYGLNQQGLLLNNAGAKHAANSATASSWTNTLQMYNLTSGASSTTGATAGGIAITGISNAPTAAGTTFSGAGITYSSGYAILSKYSTTASGVTTTTYEMSPFFANSTLNGTKVTVAAQSGLGNYFADLNGALWFGGYSLSTSSLVTTGQVGKLVAQLYNAGSILASFFALISLLLAALFAF